MFSAKHIVLIFWHAQNYDNTFFVKNVKLL